MYVILSESKWGNIIDKLFKKFNKTLEQMTKTFKSPMQF